MSGPGGPQAIVDALGDPALAVAPDGTVVAANERLGTLLGGARELLAGVRQHEALGHLGEDGGRDCAACVVCRLCRAGASGTVPLWLTPRVGLPVPVEATAGPRTADAVTVVTFRDTSAQQRREHQLAELARLDPLTGLPNRLALTQELHRCVDVVDPLDEPARAGVALLLVDLDGFKDVNDRYGHPAGDLVLAATARCLAAAVRGDDLVARYGGDEFAVLLRDADHEVAVEVAERIVNELAEPVATANAQARTGASVGVAFADESEDLDSTALMAEADEALREAKVTGKGCVVVAGRGAREATDVMPDVDVTEARAWAAYIRALRDDIARAKEAKLLPAHLAAPESIHRTLLRLLSAIDHLPAQGTAGLGLPHPQRLLPFVVYVPSVLAWADRLRAAGLVSTSPTPEVDRFWSRLEDHVERQLADLLASHLS